MKSKLVLDKTLVNEKVFLGDDLICSADVRTTASKIYISIPKNYYTIIFTAGLLAAMSHNGNEVSCNDHKILYEVLRELALGENFSKELVKKFSRKAKNDPFFNETQETQFDIDK